jgi:ribonuclease E
MDQSEQLGNEESTTDAPVAPEQAAPAKAPRKRRTASAPAGAPPAARGAPWRAER